MKGYWPTSKEAEAVPMNAIPKITFTGQGLAGDDESPEASWNTPEVFSGDLKEALEHLKKRPGKPLLIHGGAKFARSAMATGTVDELRLTVCPTVFGEGAGIFSSAKPQKFKQVTLIRFPLGFVGQVLQPA